MTNKEILYFILGGLSLIGGVIVISTTSNAKSHLNKTIKEDLKKNDLEYRTCQEKTIEAANNLKKANEILQREETAIQNEVNAYKVKSGYDQTIESITKEIWKQTDDFKESISYEKEKEKLKTELDNAIGKVKDSLSYDEKIASQNKLISDANRAYDMQVLFMENNEASNAAKKAARKAKDKTIDTANEAIEELNKQLNKEVKALKKDYSEKVKALDERVTNKNKEYQEHAERLREKLRNDLVEKRTAIKESVISNRTKEEDEAVNSIQNYKNTISDMTSKLQDIERNTFNKISSEDALVLYLKDRGVKAPTVLAVGTLAGAPLFYCTYSYIYKLITITRRIAA